jgi:hypothetical protein
MTCLECDRLRAERERLLRIFAAKAEAAAEAEDSSPVSRCQDLASAAAEAQIDAVIARLEFEEHRQIHRSAN